MSSNVLKGNQRPSDFLLECRIHFLCVCVCVCVCEQYANHVFSVDPVHSSDETHSSNCPVCFLNSLCIIHETLSISANASVVAQ